jgi:hypothetical protein
MEVKEAEIYMRTNTVNRANKQKMLHCLTVTRKIWRDFVKDKKATADMILNKYPMLITLHEAEGICLS